MPLSVTARGDSCTRIGDLSQISAFWLFANSQGFLVNSRPSPGDFANASHRFADSRFLRFDSLLPEADRANVKRTKRIFDNRELAFTSVILKSVLHPCS
jgi:hypothetical protein